MAPWLVILLLASTGTDISSSTSLRTDDYHSYEQSTTVLHQLTQSHPNLVRLYSIGQSVLGKELWAVEISAGSAFLRPNVKLIGNIHGNEPVGKELLLNLAKDLVDKHEAGDARVKMLLGFARVHLLPSLNPDGFEAALNITIPGEGQACSSGPGRRNMHDFDLNRNFPDSFHPKSDPTQIETEAVKKWLREVPFILSASLHGGALVASYPFDNSPHNVWEEFFSTFNTTKLSQDDVSKLWKTWRPDNLKNTPHLTPDNDVFKYLASLYANAHPHMHLGNKCPRSTYSFPGGITNGAAWYPVRGGMQDYNYLEHGCLEITLEVSCCKLPNASELTSYWQQNREPLLSLLEQVRLGIRGLVLDEHAAPIPNASIHILGRDIPFYTSVNGEFWRILLPNVYYLHIEAVGFHNATIPIKVKPPKLPKWSQFINITLYRLESEDGLTFEVTWTNASTSEDHWGHLFKIMPTEPQQATSSGATDLAEQPNMSESRSCAIFQTLSFYLLILCTIHLFCK